MVSKLEMAVVEGWKFCETQTKTCSAPPRQDTPLYLHRLHEDGTLRTLSSLTHIECECKYSCAELLVPESLARGHAEVSRRSVQMVLQARLRTARGIDRSTYMLFVQEI